MATTETYQNGGSTTYSFTFPYYKKSDVKVEVDNVLKTENSAGLTDNDYTVNNTQIVFNSATASGTGNVHIYRQTDVDSAKAVYAAGSSIRASDLNNNETQLLYAAQEVLGNKFNTDDLKDGSITSVKITDGTIATVDLADNSITAPKIAANAVGSAQIADNAVTSSELAADSVGSVQIKDNAVTSSEIAANAVGSAQIADGAVGPSEIDANAVGSAQIADGAVGSSEIAADAVGSAQIADGAVGPSEIAANAVGSAQIADGAVGSSELDANSVGTVQLKTDAVTTNEIADAELTTLAGMPSATASILASGTALTSTTTELNQLDGKTLGETSLTTNSDTAIPTSKAVNDRILTVTNALGGFVAIADKDNFPTSHPDPSGNAGTVVSISDAVGISVNSSGVGSLATRAGGSDAVIINGFPTALRGGATVGDSTNADPYVLIAGTGLQVQTTSTAHTYDYHKTLTNETDVNKLSGDIQDFQERYRVASSAPGSSNDE